tara:strand:+ start:17182 stop:18513 length:1332 start_codon:yes stop_codon:yes gene_type:complete
MSTLRVDNIKSRTGSVVTVPETNTLAVTGIVSVTSSGSLRVAGDEVIAGDQSVSGNSTISGNQVISNDQTITNNQTISGNQTVSGHQNITGLSTYAGNVDITGIIDVKGGGSIISTTGIVTCGTLNVVGTSTVTGGAWVSGIQTISGSQHITQNQLVTGLSTYQGSVDVTGNLNMSGGGSIISTTGIATVGSLNVLNTTTFNNIVGDVTNLNVAGIATFAGGVSIGGTLTYEDVTNIDSVGVITARSSINAMGFINLAERIDHTGDPDTHISFADNNIKLTSGGIEAISATSTGVTFKSPQEGQIVIQDSDSGNTGTAAETGIKFADGAGTQQSIIGHHNSGSTDLFIETTIASNIGFKINNTQVLTMGTDALLPHTDNTYNLGSSAKRFANLYTGDIQLCNEGVTNEVDGTWGSYTMQEGENDLFLINRRSGKKYRFNLTEV